jgi:hypothetical protein
LSRYKHAITTKQVDKSVLLSASLYIYIARKRSGVALVEGKSRPIFVGETSSIDTKNFCYVDGEYFTVA